MQPIPSETLMNDNREVMLCLDILPENPIAARIDVEKCIVTLAFGKKPPLFYRIQKEPALAAYEDGKIIVVEFTNFQRAANNIAIDRPCEHILKLSNAASS